MEDEVSSPCRQICQLNTNRICIGCYRSTAEIARWSRASAGEKRRIVEAALVRKEQAASKESL